MTFRLHGETLREAGHPTGRPGLPKLTLVTDAFLNARAKKLKVTFQKACLSELEVTLCPSAADTPIAPWACGPQPLLAPSWGGSPCLLRPLPLHSTGVTLVIYLWTLTGPEMRASSSPVSRSHPLPFIPLPRLTSSHNHPLLGDDSSVPSGLPRSALPEPRADQLLST